MTKRETAIAAFIFARLVAEWRRHCGASPPKYVIKLLWWRARADSKQ